MTTEHYLVTATYVARPDTADTVARLLVDLAAASRIEPGNLSYTIARDLETPTVFVINERYVDAEAFGAHRESEHFQRIGRGTIIPLLEERIVAGYHGDGVIA